MKGLIWVHGRLAWPLVIGIAYLAIALVLGDYFWRVLVMPFMTFFLYAAVIATAVPVLSFAGWLLMRGEFHRSPG